LGALGERELVHAGHDMNFYAYRQASSFGLVDSA